MNTIIISMRVRQSARLRCKEKWYNRQTVQMGRKLSSLRSTMDKGVCSRKHLWGFYRYISGSN